MNILLDWLSLKPFWKPLTGLYRVVVTVESEETGRKESLVFYWTQEEWTKYKEGLINP